MKGCLHLFLATLLVAFAISLDCFKIPTDPALEPDNSTIRLFVKDGSDPVVDYGSVKEIGLEMHLLQHLKTITIVSACGHVDTSFSADSSLNIDTVYIMPVFDNEGQCVISAIATMRDESLKDKTYSLTIHVLPEKPGISFVSTPSSHEMTVQLSDTLQFIIRTVGGAAVPVSYILNVAPNAASGFFTTDYSLLRDTVKIIAMPSVAGACTLTLVAATHYNNATLSDTATVVVTVKNRLEPAVVKIPDQLFAGKADTLVFAVNTSADKEPQTIALITESPLDPEVFTIVPTEPDSILIAIAASERVVNVKIGIVVSSGSNIDTTWYPVISNTTILDSVPPEIRQIAGPVSGARVKNATGTLTFLVSDYSGVDTVWWTLNSKAVDKSVIKPNRAGEYELMYTFSDFGMNKITFYAKDVSQRKNLDSADVMLIYNSVPSAVTIVAPADNAVDVATEAVFTWNGGTDADGDSVYYVVTYGIAENNFTSISSETSKCTLAIPVVNALAASTRYFWRVIAFTKAPYADTIISDSRVFTTAGIPAKIRAQPQLTDTLFAGATLTLTVEAFGAPMPTYQWYKGTDVLSGENRPTLIKSGAAKQDDGIYTVVVKNGVGADDTSKPVTVRVFTKVSVTIDPESKSANEGDQVIFTASASGDPEFTYQWQFDNQDLQGQRSRTLTLSNVTPADNGKYRCIINNSFSKDTSREAMLMVVPLLTYKVIYDANGGSGSVADDKSYKSGEWATIKSASSLSRPGYSFANWTVERSGSGNSYNSGNTLQIGSDSIILWAQWIRNACTISFNGNGATSDASPMLKSIDEGDSLGAFPAEPKKTSYVFSGWWTGENGTGDSVTRGKVFTSSQTVYAHWVIMDADRNIYTEVKIGDQVWMVENLKTKCYRNGTKIPVVIKNEDWAASNSPGICWYNNDSTNFHNEYGVLYNWFAIADQSAYGIAPLGWHLPTDNEWRILSTYLNENGFGSPYIYDIAKSLAAKTNWANNDGEGVIGNNLLSNNGTGFTAFPGGFRDNFGEFFEMGNQGGWWSITEDSPSYAWNRELRFNSSSFFYFPKNKLFGFSVRCIRDY